MASTMQEQNGPRAPALAADQKSHRQKIRKADKFLESELCRLWRQLVNALQVPEISLEAEHGSNILKLVSRLAEDIPYRYYSKYPEGSIYICCALCIAIALLQQLTIKLIYATTSTPVQVKVESQRSYKTLLAGCEGPGTGSLVGSPWGN